MQQELLDENSQTRIRILSINLAGLESSVPLESSFGPLPILQDTPDQNVWAAWGATWRDVMMLNADNVHVDTYNLTPNDLADPVKYAELKSRLKAVAGEP